ncbi:MAG: pentapeptide repeat-containing protein [bacterium]
MSGALQHCKKAVPRPRDSHPGLPAWAAAGLFLPAGGCSAQWLEGTVTRLELLLTIGGFLAIQAVVLAVVFTALFRVLLPFALRGWEARTEKARTIRQLLGELRHLRLLDSEAGVLRKTGMIRDLNALDEIPPELEGCLLSGADLRGVALDGCDLRGAKLSGADLQGASLAGAELFGADLAGANLTFANLHGANLRGAGLEGARLNKADLRNCNLHRANLVDADLNRARLEGATLDKARFLPEGGDPLRHGVHPSVEDWIRARLDYRGIFRPDREDGERPQRLSDAI